jgi:hypothetical protein
MLKVADLAYSGTGNRKALLPQPQLGYNFAKSMSEPSKLRIYDPVIEAYKKDVDRTLIRENLRLTVEERFKNLMMLQQFAEELDKNKRHPLNDVNKLP